MQELHVEGWLDALARDRLEEPKRSEVLAHVTECAQCSETLRRLQMSSTPSPLGKVQLTRVALTTTPSQEIELIPADAPMPLDLVHEVAALLDIDQATAERAVARLEDPAGWAPGPAPGVLARFARGGPSRSGATSLFVRQEPRSVFPRHLHRGREIMLVLSGVARERGGSALGPGARLEKAEGTIHELLTVGREPCICLVVVDAGGVEFLSDPLV